ncbi:MAG: hypothetical protein J6R35_00455 [Clostridia bacterium]|nr:hypothetical protein [Clostridia bacterium]
MQKFFTKRNIIILVIISVVVLALVAAIIVMAVGKNEVKTSEASVTRGSLATSINASGVVADVGISEYLPLFVAIHRITDIDTIIDYAGDDFDWTYALLNSTSTPIAYKVTYVNTELRNVKTTFSTEDDNVVIMRVAPYFINWTKLDDAKNEAILNGDMPAGSTTADYLMMLIFTNQDDPYDIPAEYLELSTDPNKEVVVDTDYLKRIVQKSSSLEENGVLEYAISNLNVIEDATVTAKTNIFKITLTQLYTSFSVTEYDVADIDKKIRAGEKVYAGVTINALGGRKVIAEIQEIIKGNYSSGIAYYAVQAKIIFGVEKTLDLTVENNLHSSAAQVAKNKGKTELKYASFEYYDPYLTPEKVESLGIDITDIVEREEVLTNYSVTIKVQKTAVIDKLIIPTKCIFYDDSKTPYVLVKRDNKEVRVYIKVLLSTGSEAAVEVREAKDENKLSDGDKIIYQADSSLISSILG